MTKRKDARCTRDKNEEGIYLVLSTVASLLLLTGFVVLALETTLSYRVTYELRKQLDKVCRETITFNSEDKLSYMFPPGLFQYATRIYFMEKAKTINVKNAVNVRARLVVPTMADVTDSISEPKEKLISQLTISTNQAENQNFNLEQMYFRTPRYGDFPSETFPFGKEVFTNGNEPVSSAGNTIGCSVTVRLSSTLSKLVNFFRPTKDPREITAYSAWQIPVNGTPAKDSDLTLNSAKYSTGLTIAIAPEMGTEAWKDQFLFGNYSTVGPALRYNVKPEYSDPGFEYDPLRSNLVARRSFKFGGGASWGSAFGNLGIGTCPGDVATSNGDCFPSKLPLLHNSARSVLNTLLGPIPAAQPAILQNQSAFSTITPNDRAALGINSDQDEMTVACANPIVTMRNTFIASILELAQRHGQLRNRTEILYVNPLGFAETPQANGSKPQPVMFYGNAPIVEMVPYGADLAQRDSYELPYVNFEAGDRYSMCRGGSPNCTYTNSPMRWLNPYPTNKITSLRNHHALMTQQLRVCEHLYYADSVNAANRDGVQRPSLSPLFSNTIDPTSRNIGFDPDSFHNYRTFIYPNGAGPSAWTYAPTDSNALSADRHPLITPSELVSMIGSVQSCPYEMGVNFTPTGPGTPQDLINSTAPVPAVGEDAPPAFIGSPFVTTTRPDPRFGNPNAHPPIPAQNTLTVCRKPPPQYELRPDNLSLINYLTGQRVDGNINNEVDDLYASRLVPLNSRDFFKAGLPTYQHPTMSAAGIQTALRGLIDIDTRRKSLPSLNSSPPAVNDSTAILYILHRPPTPAEVPQIQMAVNRLQRVDNSLTYEQKVRTFRFFRPITVVYIPTNTTDASVTSVDNVSRAFWAPTTNNPVVTGNYVVVLSPYLEVYRDPKYYFGPGKPLTEQQNMDAFLRASLTITDPFLGVNVVNVAQKIFYQRILKAPQAKQ